MPRKPKESVEPVKVSQETPEQVLRNKLSTLSPSKMLSYIAWVGLCFADEEYMRQYDRLRGTSLGRSRRSPMECLIDKVCGFVPADFASFLLDCYDLWERINHDDYTPAA